MNVAKRLPKIGFEVIENRVRLAKESQNRMKEQTHKWAPFSLQFLSEWGKHCSNYLSHKPLTYGEQNAWKLTLTFSSSRNSYIFFNGISINAFAP